MRIIGSYDVVMASLCLYLYVCHCIAIDIYIYIYIYIFVLIFLKIGGLCLSFLLDWFGVQREEFLLRHEEESEQIKNMEKKIVWRS